MATIEIDIDDEHAKRVVALADKLNLELNEFMSLSWAVVAVLLETPHTLNGQLLREYAARPDRFKIDP